MNSQDLQYALDHGIIDVSQVRLMVELKKREEYIEKHPFKIWEGQNGKWYTYVSVVPSGRKMIKRNSEAALKDAIADFYINGIEHPTVRQIFYEWNDRRRDLGYESYATHSRNVDFFERHFKKAGEWKIEEVTQEQWQEFIEDQVSKLHLNQKSFCGLKGIIKGTLKRAKRKRLISYNIAEIFYDLDVPSKVLRTPPKNPETQVYTQDEVAKIEKYIREHAFDVQKRGAAHNEAVKNLGILLLFATGMRAGELVALKTDSFSEQIITVRRTETHWRDEKGSNHFEVEDRAKTEKGQRDIVVPKKYHWLTRIILTLPRDTDWIFEQKGERITERMIARRLHTLCDKLEIPYRSPHKIRKTYGSILLDNHVDERFIKDQMGHTDISMTESHYHFNRKTNDQKQDALDAIPEFAVNGL